MAQFNLRLINTHDKAKDFRPSNDTHLNLSSNQSNSLISPFEVRKTTAIQGLQRFSLFRFRVSKA